MLELTVLGSAGSYPAPGLPCSGYLISEGNFTLLMDVGAGSLSRWPADRQMADLDAVVITHMHPDHCSDIFVLSVQLEFFSGRTTPMPLYGPPGSDAKMAAFGAPTVRGFDGVFSFTPWEDRGLITVGPLTIQSVRTTHILPTFALRVQDASGHSITFTADTGPCSAVERLAADTDLLLAEATWFKKPRPDPVDHLTPEQAGELATRSNASELVLTHLLPSADPLEALARAATRYDGTLRVASPGDTYKVGKAGKARRTSHLTTGAL